MPGLLTLSPAMESKLPLLAWAGSGSFRVVHSQLPAGSMFAPAWSRTRKCYGTAHLLEPAAFDEALHSGFEKLPRISTAGSP